MFICKEQKQIFKMKRNCLPFVVESKLEKHQIRCSGCKSLINADNLRIGVREYKSTSWFHYACFWTNCYYRNHLRGVDGSALYELVDGLNTIGPSDRNKLLEQACAAPTERRRSLKPEVIYEGSEAGGDYELDGNTFDLSNLICVGVVSHQSNAFVSIRKYFIPRGRTIAKPTKTGITLTRDQWWKMESCADDISDAIATTQKAIKDKEKEKQSKKDKAKDRDKAKDSPDWIIFSLSWKRRVGIYASGDDPVIDIRDFSEEKTFSESDRGIKLTADQWKQLLDNSSNINRSLDALTK